MLNEPECKLTFLSRNEEIPKYSNLLKYVLIMTSCEMEGLTIHTSTAVV